MLVGPGTGCWECGGVYGEHREDCKNGRRIRSEREFEEKEDAIHKVDLLARIERLEKMIAICESQRTKMKKGKRGKGKC